MPWKKKVLPGQVNYQVRYSINPLLLSISPCWPQHFKKNTKSWNLDYKRYWKRMKRMRSSLLLSKSEYLRWWIDMQPMCVFLVSRFRLSRPDDRFFLKVDTLSELFVAWDDTLSEAEDKLSRMEKEKAERLRLGLEWYICLLGLELLSCCPDLQNSNYNFVVAYFFPKCGEMVCIYVCVIVSLSMAILREMCSRVYIYNLASWSPKLEDYFKGMWREARLYDGESPCKVTTGFHCWLQ